MNKRKEMLAFIFLIPLQAATARFLVSKPVLKVMYGNIGVVADLQIPPDASRRTNEDSDFTYGNHEDLPEFQDFLEEVEDMQQWNSKLNSSSPDLDMKDLSHASKVLTDLKNNLQATVKDQHETRRKLDLDLPAEINKLWRNPVELREWYYMKLCLTYLIHIRFQVDTATRQKMSSQFLSGYKIGYLFHRLMRLKSQMYRIMEEWSSMKTQREIQNRPNWRTKTHNFKMLLQMYERMLQLDVDVKDTVEMIKMAHWKREIFKTQLYEPTTKHLWKK